MHHWFSGAFPERLLTRHLGLVSEYDHKTLQVEESEYSKMPSGFGVNDRDTHT